MKGLKKYFGIILTMIMVLAVIPVLPVYASGKVVVAVSKSPLNIGDTVTVTATAKGPGGEQVTTTLGFNYDSSKLSFVSCSESTYSGGGGGYVGVVAENKSVSITLKAESAGSAAITVNGSDAIIFDTNEEIGSLSAAGATITINNTASNTTTNNENGNTENKSPDNSLSSLKISPGTLSPAFKYSVTNYTATVGSDVNEIAIDAKPSNSKATVESVTGNTNLKEGENTIRIVVKAENGTTATYTIVVTKGGTAEQPQEEKPEEETPEENTGAIMINGQEYNLSSTIPDDKVPEGFTKTTVNCMGRDVEAAQHNMGNVILVYLTTPNVEVRNTLAVFDQETGVIYPFVKLTMGNSYFIILNPPAETGLSEEYTASAVEIGEYGAIASYENQESGAADFCLLYAISNNGNMGWYQYDKVEGTLQRYNLQDNENADGEVDVEALNADMKGLQNAYDKLEKTYDKEKSSSQKVIAVLVFFIAVLIVVIVNLILRWKRDEDEWEDNFEDVPERLRKASDKTEGKEKNTEEKKKGILKKTKPSEENEPEKDESEKNEPEKSEAEKSEPEKKTLKRKVLEKKAREKKVPEKKVSEEEKKEENIPDEKDDFEVIDLDDL